MVYRYIKYSTSQWLAVEHLCHLDAVSDALASSVSLNVPVLAKIYNLAKTMPSWQLLLAVGPLNQKLILAILSDLWDPHTITDSCWSVSGLLVLDSWPRYVMLLCCSRASNPFYYYPKTPKTWLLSFGLCNHINISSSGVWTVFRVC